MKFEHFFDHFKGQPVEILTDDRIRYFGIVLDSDSESVEIIDRCSRVIVIDFRHIDAVVEPKMRLTRFCRDNDCDCRCRHDDDCDCRRRRDDDRDYWRHDDDCDYRRRRDDDCDCRRCDDDCDCRRCDDDCRRCDDDCDCD